MLRDIVIYLMIKVCSGSTVQILSRIVFTANTEVVHTRSPTSMSSILAMTESHEIGIWCEEVRSGASGGRSFVSLL